MNVGKVSVQEKVAELERRIADLEKHQFTDARATQTVRRVEMEPEMGRVWKAVDDLFVKLFGK